jgi:aryl-phospho-beta-D-glucosidase BglC (GH1 family)
MKYFIKTIACSLLFFAVSNIYYTVNAQRTYFTVKGKNIIAPDGKPFLIQGINLGNWLNPEGYMLLFKDVSSFRLIDQALKELVGGDVVDRFWRQFQENYITRDDIHYIKQTGMNTIRLPFHYKLFTSEDYMGNNDAKRGFELIDRIVNFCKENGLYVILDMHDAPGGQTGDNIDDSYGYPWLLENENNQNRCCEIWQTIAKHYANEPAILGYDLLNEPIAHYFENKEELNQQLEPLYKKIVAAIRKVDQHHIVMLGGAQWNSNFKVFSDTQFDTNLMYTCHRYKCDTLQSNIQDLLNFYDKVNLPLYMGETGENTDWWVGGFRRLLEQHNMGWTFWPFKKLNNKACMVSVKEPENWHVIVEYTQKDNSSFKKIRENRPSQALVLQALNEYLENMKFANCTVNKGYIEALGMKP